MYAALLWLLMRLPAESAHHLGFFGLRVALGLAPIRAVVARWLAPSDPRLAVRCFGVDFRGPVGLAAGFDKDGLGPDALGALGFGFVEVGTVTAQAQPGNPKPRMFRLPADRALLNRLGFNNRGAEAAARRLERRRPDAPTVVGVNVGKTKIVPEEGAAADFASSARAVAKVAAYCVVNVSSPNTPGLRDLQAVGRLAPILSAVRRALDEGSPERRVPLLVKIAPDLSDDDVDAVADLALELGLEGIVATNTTLSREGLRTPAERVKNLGAGGVSGAPVAARSIAILRRLRARVGDRLVLVSVGGISTVDEAWARIRAGASLIQMYTGFIYGGPLVPSRLHRGLRLLLDRHGFATLADAIGSEPQTDETHDPS